MATIDGEISRLRHKDQSVRRKAVRNLFDFDNPRALTGFVDLLNDKDQWFRSKAIEAHRKWASKGEHLVPLLKTDKRIAAEILQTVKDLEIAKVLIKEEDHIVRSFASKILISDESYHDDMALDEHHSVRCIVAENTDDSNLIQTLINDIHPIVATKALDNAFKKDIKLDDALIGKLLGSNDEILRGSAAQHAIYNGGDNMILAIKDTSSKVRKIVSKSIKEMIPEVDDRITLIAKHNPETATLWLRGKYDEKSSELRWKMIENNQISSMVRSKLIQQLDGKTAIDISRVIQLEENEDELIKLSAINLSASYYELTGEER